MFQSGELNPRWKGGKTKTVDGYIRIKAGKDRDKLEHRLLYEQQFGPIPDGFDVHHKNAKRDDNRMENFELRESKAHRMAALGLVNKRKKKRLPRRSRFG